MKSYKIFIDVGTTNSRVYLTTKSLQLIAMRQEEIGARNTALNNSNQVLKDTLKELLQNILFKNSLSFSDIAYICAFGMIGSEFGLIEVPHCPAPANTAHLAKHVQEVYQADLAPIPIHIIPGVKSLPTGKDSVFDIDIMRGEEVEVLGILSELPRCPSEQMRLIILPGSHTKSILISSKNKILHSMTSMTGELLSCITNNTILSEILEHKYLNQSEYNFQYVCQGYNYSKKYGFGRACFFARILHKLYMYNRIHIANYLLGVVLENDFSALYNMSCKVSVSNLQIIISGKEPFLTALRDLFLYEPTYQDCKILTLPIPSVPYSIGGAETIMTCYNKKSH